MILFIAMMATYFSAFGLCYFLLELGLWTSIAIGVAAELACCIYYLFLRTVVHHG